MITRRKEICNAITNEDRVSFVYNGEAKKDPRIVDLYFTGSLKSNTNKTDLTKYARGWQISGHTNSAVGEWKLFNMDLISNFKTVKNTKIDKTLPKPKYDGTSSIIEIDSNCSI